MTRTLQAGHTAAYYSSSSELKQLLGTPAEAHPTAAGPISPLAAEEPVLVSSSNGAATSSAGGAAQEEQPANSKAAKVRVVDPSCSLAASHSVCWNCAESCLTATVGPAARLLTVLCAVWPSLGPNRQATAARHVCVGLHSNTLGA